MWATGARSQVTKRSRGWPGVLQHCWPSATLGRATGSCCGPRTVPSGSPRSTAALLRGVLTVPLDVYGTPEFAARIASDVRPSLVVGDAALLLTMEGEWPKLFFEDWPAALPTEEAGPVAGLTHDTPLQILFTSGTTGEPKGIVHTHGNVLASLEPIEQAARGYLRYERLVHPLRFLHTLPLSHVFGQTMGLWIPPIFAAEVHFESRLTAPRLIETIRRERISVLAGVPRVLAVLKSHLETEYPDLPARLAAAQGLSAFKRWWRFRDIHAAFGLKFWAFITGGGALPGPDRAVLERTWLCIGPGIRHDGNSCPHHPQSPFPSGPRHHGQAAARPGGEAAA